jgi:hypothetical protein
MGPAGAIAQGVAGLVSSSQGTVSERFLIDLAWAQIPLKWTDGSPGPLPETRETGRFLWRMDRVWEWSVRLCPVPSMAPFFELLVQSHAINVSLSIAQIDHFETGSSSM